MAWSVRIGDEARVTVPDSGWERVVAVRKLLTKRVAAPLVVAAYADRIPLFLPRGAARPVFVRQRGYGRPTKRDRRALDTLRATRRAYDPDDSGR